MNIRLLAKLLGTLSALIGAFMLFSMPWALPNIGRRTDQRPHGNLETESFWALLASMAICFVVAAVLYGYGRRAKGRLYRKEAMAVVGLSWILATVLGALPYWFSGTCRGPAVRIIHPDAPPLVARGNWQWFRAWRPQPVETAEQFRVIQALVDAKPNVEGLSLSDLRQRSGIAAADEVFAQLKNDANWSVYLVGPGEEPAPFDRASNYRLRWTRMTICDALFESQSGFSTTGASVISELQDTQVIQYSMLFWRSSTHFLGGLGIIVLFVVLLGQGSAGKALMRTEVPGPTAEGTSARMQHSAWAFAGIYVALVLILTVILMLEGMSAFDVLCHSFGTMATGGFSTYNNSVGFFADKPAIAYTIIVFMILAGTNFTLMYLFLLRQPGKLLADVEWRTYLGIILVVTALIVTVGVGVGDSGFESAGTAMQNGLFQVASIITTTGFSTHDFDQWNQLSRLLLLILMFVGGCAGSTGGGMKVIRHVLFGRILWIQLERAFHPRVVRPLRASGDESVDDAELSMGILVYFGLVLTLFVFGWLFIVGFEPDSTWGDRVENKLIDSASSVVATLNNIGPGLGSVGPSQNYGNFSGLSKIMLVWMMMLGRLEIWPILVLFAPSFWRDQ